jgi:hypothetical protein
MDGITYVNTGDWVESLTAVVEHEDGRLELVNWPRALAGERREAARPLVLLDGEPRRQAA